MGRGELTAPLAVRHHTSNCTPPEDRASNVFAPALIDFHLKWLLSVRGHGRSLDATHVCDLVNHLGMLPDNSLALLHRSF